MSTVRLSIKQKEANNFKWYKDKADLYESNLNHKESFSHHNNRRERLKANYDLFNNKLNLKDFEYVCKPLGEGSGNLPANMQNKDIISPKIKVILGMENSNSFEWNVIATNPEATTRKEEEKFKRFRDYTVEQIMKPIQDQAQMKVQQQIEMLIQQAQQASEEEQAQIQQQIEQLQQQAQEEVAAQTPPEIEKYMSREHQDPAEVLSNQLLKYLIRNYDVERKMSTALKHGLLSATEVMLICVMNNELVVENVNSMEFTCGQPEDDITIETAEWAVARYRMSLSKLIKLFGDSLKEKDIDEISSYISDRNSSFTDDNDFFEIYERDGFLLDDIRDDRVEVIHCTWRSLRKVGFLTYQSQETEEILTKMVNENYILNLDFGDIDIEWKWLPEIYETWKIKTPTPIYVNTRPIPGQFRDKDRIFYSPLPYKGVIYDNMNSESVSLMDRLKYYQYYYNIIMYRLELLMASDKGKKLLMNIGAIPTESGMTVNQWQYFFESTPFAWFNPNEEGSNYQDVNNVAKVIDMSLISDIRKYYEFGEYIKQQAGKSVGISDSVEGQGSPYESNDNRAKSLNQTNFILSPYFNLHNYAKKNFLTALIENAKVLYSGKESFRLSYITDDLTQTILEVDTEMLENNSYGLFVVNQAKTEDIKGQIIQLSQAALQNGKVEMSDIIKILRSDSILESSEILEVAEKKSQERERQQQQSQQQHKKELQESEQKFQKELIVLKEEERRKTVIAQGAITGMSFNPELDENNNDVNDFMDIAKNNKVMEVLSDKQKLEREKFEHKKNVDNKQLQQKDAEIKIKNKNLQQKAINKD